MDDTCFYTYILHNRDLTAKSMWH